MNRPVPGRREAAGYVDILFYTQVVLLVAGALLGLASGLGVDTGLLDLAVNVLGEAVILYALAHLSPLEPMLRRAFWAGAASILLDLVTAGLELAGAPEALLLAMLLAQAVVAMLTVYYMFHGLGLVAVPVSSTLPGSWAKIWKWYLGLFFATLASILLAMPLISLLVSVVGALAIQIWEARLLYDTAQALRQAPEAGAPPMEGGPL